MRLTIVTTLCLSAACGSDPPPSRAPAVDIATWYARHEAPCGRSLLAIARAPGGPVTLVQPEGDAAPSARLRHDVLLASTFVVHGQLTGEIADDGHCGAYPRFVVHSFEPWGDVRRAFSAATLGPELHRYTETLPRDRLVPEDFEGTGSPRYLDADACTPSGTCAPPALAQTDSAGQALCCPLAS